MGAEGAGGSVAGRRRAAAPSDRLRAAAVAAADHAVATARLTRDLPPFLRARTTADAARTALLGRLARRDDRFLALVERTVFGNPASPYRALLRQAGCELGDLRALVADAGVEAALRTLAERGVYVTFDEFKGRRPAVRGSASFAFDQRQFDNPLNRPHFVRYTSGSGGPPSRVAYSLALVDEWAQTTSLTLQAHGIDRPEHAFWSPGPLHWLFSSARLGQPVTAWFYPLHPHPRAATLLARYVAVLGRLAGHRFPIPERADLERTDWMLAWLARNLGRGRPLVLWTMASAATRLGLAAREAGHDLTGLTIRLVGEPVTEARRRHIEAAGARAIVQYSTVEIPAFSYSCAAPAAADDVHVMTDRFAVVQHQRAVGEVGLPVDALLISALSPTAPKILLNTEPGDYGILETRDCGCLLGELGLRTHLSEIRSFEKLTGEGVTFARSNLQQILEETLPARFGGAALDYQLVEDEAPNGTIQLVLRVDPAVGPLDEAALRSALLDELGRGSLIDRYQAEIWRRAGTLTVSREPPRATRAGKVLPFSLLRGASAGRTPRG